MHVFHGFAPAWEIMNRMIMVNVDALCAIASEYGIGTVANIRKDCHPSNTVNGRRSV